MYSIGIMTFEKRFGLEQGVQTLKRLLKLSAWLINFGRVAQSASGF
jgi:hypothetical protein